MLDGNDIETCSKSEEPSEKAPPPRIVVHPPSSNEDMGNGSSQSIVLGPPRFQSSAYPIRASSNGYGSSSHLHGSSSVPKYVHPQNRVLPKPVLNGQPPRLRSTDNGSILQAAGTIRGAGGHREAEAYRRGSGDITRDYDPDEPSRQRYNNNHHRSSGHHHGEKENERYVNLRNHRLFHSDPNIARRPMGESPVEGYSNRRGCSNGGAAGRASKLKYKKKARAPEPPGSGNSLPRDLERTQKNNNCKCIAKSRAPQPPSIVVHPPPPPPPMPDSGVTTRTNIGANKSTPRSDLSSSVTRAVECRDSRTSYEKNVHPLEKWRNCRSTGDVRMDEQQEDDSSRTTVFDSRKVPQQDSSQSNKSYLPQHRPDPFQKEIQMVTKKIAESRQTPPHQDQPQKPPSSPPKFYFSDPSVFKADPPAATKHPEDHRVMEDSRHKPEPSSGNKAPDGGRRGQNHTTVDEVVPSLQRFSPGRQRYKPTSRSTTPTPKQKAEKEWEDLSKSLYHKQEEESKIDIRLRPVLPRKTPDAPKFSPSEAWQALGSDGQGSSLSNPSTSDDGRDLTPRRYSDMDYRSYQPRSLSDSHWTPRQDLSDVSSEDEGVSPHGGEVVIPARFSLPTVMFSNMRPIGTEVNKAKVPEQQGKGSKKNKKVAAAPPMMNRFDDHHQQHQQPGFRRFLSRRNKYQSEEDIAVSADSNWTFGQYGLQKRGKQYSSELMLSDRKKYELMAKNDIGDFLGDILASKSNHLRDQMKSSDSGNSNFSFYSTDGQVMYKGREECSPPTKGRVYDMRRRFDANFESTTPKGPPLAMTKKKKAEADLGRRRDLELAKMLEDEVRKRRNKEKISIRQQLQRMKSNFRSDDEDEDDFDDEAYFTEPKSREEETQSPFFSSDVGLPQTRFGGPSRTVVDSARLSHWQSSPALLEDSMRQNGMQPSAKGRLSLSSLMSSPDSGAWLPNDVDHWLMKQQPQVVGGRRMSEGDGGSSSPTPAAAPKKKERRRTNIYKQLMDIVRKEERQLKNAQRGSGGSPTSSSHRESSSETASTTSYSDSSSESAPSAGGVPANREFGFRHSLQPYSPAVAGKGYRPVPFDLPASANHHYRLPGLQEEGKHLQAEVS